MRWPLPPNFEATLAGENKWRQSTHSPLSFKQPCLRAVAIAAFRFLNKLTSRVPTAHLLIFELISSLSHIISSSRRHFSAFVSLPQFVIYVMSVALYLYQQQRHLRRGWSLQNIRKGNYTMYKYRCICFFLLFVIFFILCLLHYV